MDRMTLSRNGVESRMADEELEFPDHARKEGQIRPGIEVSIDFLPKKYRNAWHRAVHTHADRWLQKNRFQKTATIWMWGCMSVNLISRHPDTAVPSWSDFLIQFGLPSAFWDQLRTYLDREFAGQCGSTEMMQAKRDDGWCPICHIEQGKVWTLADADTWSPFARSSSSRRSAKS